MKSTNAAFVLYALFLSSINTPICAQSILDKLDTAVSDSTLAISLRYRAEFVEQANALKDATASTLRTRMTWNSGTINGFSALLEVDNVTALGADTYDSFVLDKYRNRYSIIADAEGTEINQAVIRYTVDDKQTLQLGNQRILHADQRFVGGVAWRQNEQTFDAFSYRRRTENLELDYSYIWNVNRIFASSRPSAQRANLNSDSHIGLATLSSDLGIFSAFVYALDLKDLPVQSSTTFGLTYSRKLGDFSVRGSIADQSDYGANPVSFHTQYLAANLSYAVRTTEIGLGYELLGSDNGKIGFMTPLATLHKWQGWSDLFLSTPAAGIEDKYVSLTLKPGKAVVTISYHDFTADTGNTSYGTEWDFEVRYALTERVNAELKYATYDHSSYGVNTDKLWLSLNLAF